jgi:RimJ/RimL family protein N-acetyltransferase
MKSRNDGDSIPVTEEYCLARHLRTDAPELVEHLSNAAISQNLLLPPFPYTLEDAHSWHDFVEQEKSMDPDTARFRWVIRDGSKKLVGDISLTKTESGTYRLGYWLSERCWGKGIMTASVRAAINFAREQTRGETIKIFAEVKKGNVGSVRVLEKNGFHQTGEVVVKLHAISNGYELLLDNR